MKKIDRFIDGFPLEPVHYFGKFSGAVLMDAYLFSDSTDEVRIDGESTGESCGWDSL